MSAMTARQQRFLVESYGTYWSTADLLLSDDGITRVKASIQGGSLHDADGYAREFRGHYSTSGRGIQSDEITLVDDGAGVRVVSEVVIPWSAITAHRATLTAALLERLATVRAAATQHSRDYPVWHHPETVRRVGPSQDLHPDDRAEHARLHEVFRREQVDPWQARSRELDAEMRAAILACLPLALDHEPTDLLEMLEDMK